MRKFARDLYFVDFKLDFFSDGIVMCTPYRGIWSDFGYFLVKITINIGGVMVIELKTLRKLTILSIMDDRGRKMGQ